MAEKITYYDDNGKKIKEKYTVNADGKKEGSYERYYDDGRLFVKCTIRNGVGEGPYELYNQNGKLREKGTCKNGKIDGPYERYSSNGQLTEKTFYLNGKEVDEATWQIHQQALSTEEKAEKSISEQPQQTTPERHALAEKLKEIRKEYGHEAKSVAAKSKTVKALRDKAAGR